MALCLQRGGRRQQQVGRATRWYNSLPRQKRGRQTLSASRAVLLPAPSPPPAFAQANRTPLHPCADAELRCSFETLWAIGAGRLRIMTALFKQKLTVVGSKDVFRAHMYLIRPAFEALKYAVRLWRRDRVAPPRPLHWPSP